MRARILASLLSMAGVAVAGSVVAAAPAQADGTVVAVSGDLTNRPAGAPAPGAPAARQLTSAGVRVVPNGDDVLIGPLRPEYAQPVLEIVGVELLGSHRLRVVRGVWTSLDVVVRNTGTGSAAQVVVSGKAAGKSKGLKVKPGTVPYEILPGSTGTARVRVKLTRGHAVKLALTVSGGGVQAAGTAWIKPGKAPARLRPGRYLSKDQAVSFRVKGTRIVGFRIRTQTTCGGFPDLPTYTTNWYDMPTIRISKAGIVDAADRTPLYTATLRGQAKGAKVKARFTYGGPDRCRASESFVARRVG